MKILYRQEDDDGVDNPNIGSIISIHFYSGLSYSNLGKYQLTNVPTIIIFRSSFCLNLRPRIRSRLFLVDCGLFLLQALRLIIQALHSIHIRFLLISVYMLRIFLLRKLSSSYFYFLCRLVLAAFCHYTFQIIFFYSDSFKHQKFPILFPSLSTSLLPFYVCQFS